MDVLQLLPIHGRPPILSSHMFACLSFARLIHSVQAGYDPDFCLLQQITRLFPSEFTDEKCRHFISLLIKSCTFVDFFDDPAIPKTATYIFGRKAPGQIIHAQVMTKLKIENRYRYNCAKDDEAQTETYWMPASDLATSFLNRNCKEPEELLHITKTF